MILHQRGLDWNASHPKLCYRGVAMSLFGWLMASLFLSQHSNLINHSPKHLGYGHLRVLVGIFHIYMVCRLTCPHSNPNSCLNSWLQLYAYRHIWIRMTYAGFARSNMWIIQIGVAYRKFHPVVLVVWDGYPRVATTNNLNTVVVIVLIDFANTFYLLNHNIIIRKLVHIDTTRIILWISAFLYNRRIRWKLDL